MSRELEAALRRLDARKVAAVGEPDETGQIGDGGVSLGAGRYLLSGLDVDPEELGEFCAQARAMFSRAVVMGGASPLDTAAALFLEGVAVGLLVAEARQRA